MIPLRKFQNHLHLTTKKEKKKVFVSFYVWRYHYDFEPKILNARVDIWYWYCLLTSTNIKRTNFVLINNNQQKKKQEFWEEKKMLCGTFGFSNQSEPEEEVCHAHKKPP